MALEINKQNLVQFTNFYFRTAGPVNLLEVRDHFPETPKWLVPILKKLNLDFFIDLKHKPLAFYIPADTDDSAVNLALGSVLRKHKELSEISQKWEG